MHFTDPEKLALQRLIKEAEQAREFLQPTIEQSKKNPALNWPLIEAMQKLALRDIEANRPYLDSIRLQAIADMERYESIEKQLDQLKPIYSNYLEFLMKYRKSFLPTVSGLDCAGLNLVLSVEPTGYMESAQPQIFIKSLNDIEKQGIPIEESIEVFGLTDVISDITEAETMDFYNHLSKYPMLGLAHPVGRKIINGIEHFQQIEVFGLTLFRARVLEKGREIPYSEPEMFGAPYGKSEQGRFNVRGQGLFYAGDKLEGTIKEVSNPDGLGITVLMMKLHERLRIIDGASQKCPIFEYCNYPLTAGDPNRHAYLIPNFIAQCCQVKGIEGIRYISTQDPGMMDYVFFDVRHVWFTETSISLV